MYSEIYPQQVTKGQSITLYAHFVDGSTGGNKNQAANTLTAKVSQDGGTFNTSTNAVVKIDSGTTGHCSLVLTASEMNADVIIVNFTTSGTSTSNPTMIIYTTTSGGSTLTAEDVWTYSNRGLNALDNIILTQPDLLKEMGLTERVLSVSGFNYYGFTHPKDRWVIVREEIATGSVRYAAGKSTFVAAWADKANQGYQRIDEYK